MEPVEKCPKLFDVLTHLARRGVGRDNAYPRGSYGRGPEVTRARGCPPADPPTSASTDASGSVSTSLSAVFSTWGWRGILFGILPSVLSSGCGAQGECEDVASPTMSARQIRDDCNYRPVAIIDAREAVGKNEEAIFSGARSYDGNGDPLELRWSVRPPDGRTAQMLVIDRNRARLERSGVGRYEVSLVVRDGELRSDPAFHIIQVENGVPVADAGDDFAVVPGAMVILDGTRSSDPDGDPLTHRWLLTSRPPGSTAVLVDDTSARPSFVADQMGRFTARLVVSDGLRDSTPSEVAVESGVVSTNRPPIANPGPPMTSTVLLPVRLDGRGSSDPDGDPLTFAWRLSSVPEGSMATLELADTSQPRLRPDVAGRYEVELVVRDRFFDSAPASTSVTASPSVPGALGSVFDPRQVYMVGTLDEGLCQDAIAAVSSPNIFSTGFDCGSEPNAGVLLDDGRLIYFDRHRNLREFRVDPYFTSGGERYPVNPLSNDPIVLEDPCGVGNWRGYYLLASPYEVWFHCSDGWGSTGGRTFSHDVFEQVLAFGGEDEVLLEGTSALMIASVVSAGRTVVSTPREWRARSRVARRIDDGWLVPMGVLGQPYELIQVSLDGTFSSLGTYSAQLTTEIRVLDPDGNAYTIEFERGDEVIYRYGPDGSRERVYTEASDPIVRLLNSDLISGG